MKPRYERKFRSAIAMRLRDETALRKEIPQRCRDAATGRNCTTKGNSAALSRCGYGMKLHYERKFRSAIAMRLRDETALRKEIPQRYRDAATG